MQLLGHLHHAFHAVAVRFIIRLGGEKPVTRGSHRLVCGVFHDQRNHASLLSDMHPDKRLCTLFAGFDGVIERTGQNKRDLRLFDFLQRQHRNIVFKRDFRVFCHFRGQDRINKRHTVVDQRGRLHFFLKTGNVLVQFFIFPDLNIAAHIEKNVFQVMPLHGDLPVGFIKRSVVLDLVLQHFF